MYIKIKEHFIRYDTVYIAIGLGILSVLSSVYFFANHENLLYADAISRLNISRKIVDNITPGIAQVGNVWLPLPQLLMLPFIWHDQMWHNGLAGAIMSMAAFVIGGLYIYKAAKILTDSIVASIFALSVYALNINLLYLQSTAMSESLFMATLSAAIYYFLKYFKSRVKYHLIPAAIAVSAMTLTRYEGLAILIASIPMVYFYTLWIGRKHAQAEGNTILYAMIACLGFGLWTVYLTAIFGDPLYWKNYYVSTSLRESSGGVISGFTQNLSLGSAAWKYFTTTIWMNGLVPVCLALPAIVLMIVNDFKKKTYYLIPMLLPLSIFLFMVLTLQRNTPIVQPQLSISNIFSGDTSLKTGFNIRYGILLLPWVAIITSCLFIIKNRLMRVLVSLCFVGLMGVQVYSYFKPDYSVIYQIPARIAPKENGDFVRWMQENYDDGLIFISAAAHEDQMFEMKLPYKTFIHEGAGKYWKESLDDPPRYAKWVITDDGHNLDVIAKKPGIEVVLDRDYDVVYTKDQVKIYKITKKPYFEIKN
jgi:hypothetical protein